MEKRLYLKFPTMEDKEKVLEFKNEFIFYNSTMAGSAGLDRYNSYEEWLEKINNDISKKTCAENMVPATLFLAYRIEDNKLIGIIQIRHYLNDFLVFHGGHIGDSVRPTERGKGYATEQIALALNECKKLNIKKVLMTCRKQNLASAKTIQKNGGVLENEVIDNGETIQRYWINLENKNSKGEKENESYRGK